MPKIDATHDAGLTSWIESANDPTTDFPIQNLPYCSFSVNGQNAIRPGVRIGDQILDLNELPLDIDHDSALGDTFTMNDLAAAPRRKRIALRARLIELFRRENAAKFDDRFIRASLHKLSDVTIHLPLNIGNYTDFYASIHHAATVGAMFRPDQPLLPNYKHIPIGYHGRASSLVASGTDVRRPRGQQAPPEASPGEGPGFGPCKLLDYELEVGCVIGEGNQLGQPVAVGDAKERMMGLCLVNDWSARDMQKWEYQPLGPFLAKNFATTVSSYIVSLEALEPFRCTGWQRPSGDPQPLAYLNDEADQREGGFDITLEVQIQSAKMRDQGIAPLQISKGNAFREMYWTFAQMLAHHTSNGCNLASGDLLASGTVSGRGERERGCLLELTWDGAGKPRKPIALPSGETRTFLADGDEVIFAGYCERQGFRRIGFGECRGRIVSAT